jgi:hypothetical protein
LETGDIRVLEAGGIFPLIGNRRKVIFIMTHSGVFFDITHPSSSSAPKFSRKFPPLIYPNILFTLPLHFVQFPTGISFEGYKAAFFGFRR